MIEIIDVNDDGLTSLLRDGVAILAFRERRRTCFTQCAAIQLHHAQQMSRDSKKA